MMLQSIKIEQVQKRGFVKLLTNPSLWKNSATHFKFVVVMAESNPDDQAKKSIGNRTNIFECLFEIL